MKKSLFVCSIVLGILLLPLQASAVADAYVPKEVPNVCAASKISRGDIGGYRYPVAPKYKKLPWLGQIFTADNCGEMVFGERFDGEDSMYQWGSAITLRRRPNTNLRRILKVIGYEEITTSSNSYYSLSGEVQYYKLLLLKPYYSTIKTDDCVDCG